MLEFIICIETKCKLEFITYRNKSYNNNITSAKREEITFNGC